MIRKNDEINSDILKEIAVDFIVHEMKQADICKKHNISSRALRHIVDAGKFVKKREAYKKKVLDKALEKCSNQQANIIYKATSLLDKHVNDLYNASCRQKKRELTSAEVRDILGILAVVSKEHRLDNDEPTEKIVKKVQVEFPAGFQPITQRRDVIVEAEVVQPKEVEEPKEEEIKVEVDDDIIGSPLD